MKAFLALAAVVLTMLAFAGTASAGSAPDGIGRWSVEPTGFRWGIVEQNGRFVPRLGAPNPRVVRMAVGRW